MKLLLLVGVLAILSGCATSNPFRADNVYVLDNGKALTIWDMPGMRD